MSANSTDTAAAKKAAAKPKAPRVSKVPTGPKLTTAQVRARHAQGAITAEEAHSGIRAISNIGVDAKGQAWWAAKSDWLSDRTDTSKLKATTWSAQTKPIKALPVKPAAPKATK